MVDVFLFLLALLFIGVTAPVWAFCGLAWAFLLWNWAFLRAGFGLLLGLVSYVTGWPDMGFHKFSQFFDYVVLHILKLFEGLWDAVISVFDPLSFFWNFARYDHPWWAFFISVALLIFEIAIASSEGKNKG
jgi:hypothetical protein